MCIQNDGAADLLGEFSISETGGIDGEPGDQTGNESSIHGYYEAWDLISTPCATRSRPSTSPGTRT